MEENDSFEKAIKYIQRSYCDTHIGYPYMLLGDVIELIKILTNKEVNINELTIHSEKK